MWPAKASRAELGCPGPEKSPWQMVSTPLTWLPGQAGEEAMAGPVKSVQVCAHEYMNTCTHVFREPCPWTCPSTASPLLRRMCQCMLLLHVCMCVHARIQGVMPCAPPCHLTSTLQVDVPARTSPEHWPHPCPGAASESPQSAGGASGIRSRPHASPCDYPQSSE